MKYSIIIPHLNRTDLLKLCLQSILDAEETNFEVLVIDGGDGSSSAELIPLFTHVPSIRFLRNHEKVHFSGNVNVGIRKSTGEHIVLLNDDVVVEKKWLSKLSEPLSNENIAVVGACLLYPDKISIQHAGVAIAKDEQYWNMFHLDRGRPFTASHRAKESRKITAVTAACMLIRGSAIRKIGLFDEKFVNGYEDVDYCLRANNLGFDCIYVGDVVGIHHESASGGGIQTESANYNYLLEKWSSKLITESSAPETAFELALNKKWMEVASSETPLSSMVDLVALYKDSYPDEKLWLQQRISEAVHTHFEHGEKPVCSIVIPVFNRWDLTSQCLDSLKKNLPDLPIEIILVDNASTDETSEKAPSYSWNKHISYRYIRNDKNEFFARACNRGALNTHSEWVLFLNNDTECLPFSLTQALARLIQPHAPSALGARLLYPDSTIQHGGIQMQYGLPVHIAYNQPRFSSTANSYQELDAVTGACLFIRRNIFVDSQGFDESFVNGYEDVDLCVRLRIAGHSIGYEPSVEIIHHESKSPGRKDRDVQNTLHFLKRWSRIASIVGIKIPEHPELMGVEQSLIAESTPNSLPKPGVSNEEEQKRAFALLAQVYPKASIQKIMEVMFGERIRDISFAYLYAILEFYDKEYSNAQKLLVTYLKKYPHNTKAAFLLASCYFQLGQHRNSIPILKRLISVDPTTPTYATLLQKIEEITRQQTRNFNVPFHLSMAPDPLTKVQPEYSLVMLTKNNWPITEKCLTTLQKNSRRPYQIIFVDNASTDETRQQLAKFVSSNPNHKLILNDENTGFPVGNNLGLSLVNSPFVVCINNDVLVPESWDEYMLELFEAYPEIDVFGPMSNHVAGHQLVDDAYYTSYQELMSYAQKRKSNHQSTISFSQRVIGFCLAMRLQTLKDIGGFDPIFGIGNFEDDDFCVRAAHSGKKIAFALGWFIHHIGNQTFKDQKTDYNQILSTNWDIFRTKWGFEKKDIVAYSSTDIRFSEEKKYIGLPGLTKSHEKISDQIWKQNLSVLHERSIIAE